MCFGPNPTFDTVTFNYSTYYVGASRGVLAAFGTQMPGGSNRSHPDQTISKTTAFLVQVQYGGRYSTIGSTFELCFKLA